MGPTTAEFPTRARGDKCGTVTGGCDAAVVLSHPSAAAHAAPSARGRRLKRRAHAAPHESDHVRPPPAEDPRALLATLRHFQIKTEYSFRGPFTLEGIAFRGLTDQGFEAWPFGVFDRRPRSPESGDCRDVPYKLPSNAKFETSYAVFKASRGCLEGGSHRGRASSPRTLSNGSEPRLANLHKCFM